MNINLPKVIAAEDYHEFKLIQRIFSEFGAQVNYREIDQNKVTYAAVFFEDGQDASVQEAIDKFNAGE